MKVKWVDQIGPTSAKDALDKSIAKWRFFSYCTKKQGKLHESQLAANCALCLWHHNIRIWPAIKCDTCTFADDSKCSCHRCYGRAMTARNRYFYEHTITLAEFHAAARKVFQKLRSLRS